MSGMGAGRWALGAGRWALGAGRWALGGGRWAVGAGGVKGPGGPRKTNDEAARGHLRAAAGTGGCVGLWRGRRALTSPLWPASITAVSADTRVTLSVSFAETLVGVKTTERGGGGGGEA